MTIKTPRKEIKKFKKTIRRLRPIAKSLGRGTKKLQRNIDLALSLD